MMNKNNNIIKISGSPEGFDADLIIKEVNAGKTAIHVCRDDNRLLEKKLNQLKQSEKRFLTLMLARK